MFSIEEVFKAYHDCRRNKRTKKDALRFEIELEKHLIELHRALNDGSYTIGPTEVFVVTHPKPREIWAGQFRDRIVHHLIYNRIFERFDRQFIHDSYACRPKRGTLYGIQRAEAFARSITEGYQKRAYFLKADLANYFVTINKLILEKIVLRSIEEPELSWLIHQVIQHDPTITPIIQSPLSLFNKIEPHKSLFHTSFHKGLPIGNLTSQLFSNIYLNELDWRIRGYWGIKHYGRYVDDLILFSRDREYLKDVYVDINQFVQENLDIDFQHRKLQIQPVSHGFDFCGQVIYPYRRYLRRRTRHRAIQCFKTYSTHPDRHNQQRLDSFQGLLKQANEYNNLLKLNKE